MQPRDVARSIAIGRIATGAAMIVVPRLMSSTFLGRQARGPSTRFYARAAGIRDVVLGGLALHTVDRPEVGPRYVATAAVVDTVDGLALLAIRDEAGSAKLAFVTAIALGSAAGGAFAARGLKQQPAPAA